MDSYNDRILREFPPAVHPLTLVDDGDRLLADERVQARLRGRGFEIVHLDDVVRFRYVQESMRCARDGAGDANDLVVVVGPEVADALPFDLLQLSHRVSLRLQHLFPALGHSVLAAIDPADRAVLYTTVEKLQPGPLGDEATKDFALRHVYGVAPEAIVEPHDLLRVLLRLHYAQRRIPRVIGERLVAVLRRSASFSDWPLDAIVHGRAAFFRLLAGAVARVRGPCRWVAD